MYSKLCHELARGLGAARAMVAALCFDDALRALGLPGEAMVALPLAGEPVTCVDLRALGRETRAEGRLLVVDNTLPSWAGCAAARLGAHVTVEPLDVDVTLIGLAKDACLTLSDLPLVDEEVAGRLLAALPDRERAWRSASDTAQVVATYLTCHPRVTEVRYPGLKQDPCFEVAARTLTGGFGPLVDYRVHGDEAWRRLCLVPGVDPRDEVLRLERELLR